MKEEKIINLLPAPLAGYVMVMDEAMSKHHMSTIEARAWAHIRQELILTHTKPVQEAA